MFSKKIAEGHSQHFSPFFMSAILKVNESYIALRHHIQFNRQESKYFHNPRTDLFNSAIHGLVTLIMYSIA